MEAENRLFLYLSILRRLIASRRRQHDLRFSIQQAVSWSHRWDLPVNASKSQLLSLGDPPDLRIVLSGRRMQKCGQINDLGITVNAAFSPLANVLASANEACGVLYFTKSSFTRLTKLKPNRLGS